MIQVGFSTADITPEIGSHIPGGFSPRISTGVCDPLQVRACTVAGYEPTLCRGSKLQPDAGDRIVAETVRLFDEIG